MIAFNLLSPSNFIIQSLGNETDLSSAQQMESQTKLRVETIDHEMNMERTRHAEAVAVLEGKAKENEETKARTIESIDEKKALVEAKKEELAKIWAVSCNAQCSIST